MRKRIIFILIGTAVLLALAPGTARAEKEVVIESYNLFGGQLFPFAWNRLEVRVANKSGEDFQGSLTVELGGKYQRQIFAEKGKTGTEVFYLPPLAEVRPDYYNVSGFRLSLADGKGRGVDQSNLPGGTNPTSTNLYIGVLGRPAGDFKRLSNALDNLEVVAMLPEYLDNLSFSQNFRGIILSNPGSLTLSPRQAENLLRWLQAGGTLVLGGGSGWQQSAALVPSQLLPVQVSGVENVASADLAPLGIQTQGEKQYTLAVGQLTGEALVSAGERPLLALKKAGRGNVLWAAVDLEASPLDDAANAEAFWEKLFLLAPLQEALSFESSFLSDLFNSLAQDSLAANLSPGKLFLLLLGYILLVGPVNWLVLRKIDRRELAWLIIPAMAVLLTAGAFFYGRLGRGSDEILYQVNLVHQFSPDQALVQGLNGVFVPSTHNITIKSEGYLGPVSDQVTAMPEGEGQVLEINKPPLWSVQKFTGAGFLDLPGQVQVETQYDQAQGRLQAKATNNSGQDFFAAFIKVGQDWYEFGDLPAGGTKSATGTGMPDLQNLLLRYNHRGQVYLGWYDFDLLFSGSSVYFLGFGARGALPVEGADKVVALDLWFQPLALADFYPAGPFSVSPGTLTPAVLGSGREERWSKGEYHYYSQEERNLDLVFTLPDNLDYTVGEYYLQLGSFWGEARGTVQVYNFSLGAWQDMEELETLFKSPAHIRLDTPGDLVHRSRVRVRLCYLGDIGFNLDGISISINGGRIND